VPSEHGKDVTRWSGLLAGDAIQIWASREVLATALAGGEIEMASMVSGALFLGSMAAVFAPLIVAGTIVAIASSDEAFSKQWGQIPGALGIGMSPGTLAATVVGSLYQAMGGHGDPADATKYEGAAGSAMDFAAGVAGAIAEGRYGDIGPAAASYLATLPATYTDFTESTGASQGEPGAISLPSTSQGGPGGGSNSWTPGNPWPMGDLYLFSPGMGDLPASPLSTDGGDGGYGPPDGTLVFSMQPGGFQNSSSNTNDDSSYTNQTGIYSSPGSNTNTSECNTECVTPPSECAECPHPSECKCDCQCSDCIDCSDCEEL
jgi:hypothetical protein